MRCLALCLAMSVGCDSAAKRSLNDSANSRPDASVQGDSTSAVSLVELRDHATQHGSNRADLVARFGPPVRITADTEANRHGYGVDSLFAVEYHGLAYRLRQPAQSRNELLESVEYTDTSRTLPGNIRIDRTRAPAIAALFGEPQSREARADTTQWTYLVSPQGGEDFVRFDFVNNVLRRVVWTFYVD